MKFLSLFAAMLVASVISASAQTYNPLWIPDTLSGTQFNLTMEEGHEHWFGPNSLVMTAGFNSQTTGKYFWGPTLILRKGDTVKINVTNNLKDTTTVHWHGMHLPAIMDGGPHQPIPPGTTWKPYWKVMNNAATYWYHPHLHMMAQEQLLMGLGGMMIVRDEEEDKLALPRTYGVDDIPLALSDRAFTADGQISIEPYGDSMQVNGVIRAEHTVPSQVVRFRILNAATERSYFIGFSDNRKFSVITSDGGLLNAPVELTRYLLSSGERIEILVNFGADKGKSIRLRAFNSLLQQNIPGGDRFPNGPFANALARTDFDILKINVGDPTAKPITTIPTQLTAISPLKEVDAFITRKLSITDTMIPGNQGVSFLLNRRLFDEKFIDYKVGLNNTEIWEIANSGNFAHPFHIHDVQFNILTRNGQPPKAEEAGWKDVVLVKSRETVRFIARFDDFADSTAPYMFHCHIALHEDEGMMGQFVVIDKGTRITFTSAPALTGIEKVPYAYQVVASCSDTTKTLEFSLRDSVAGMTLSKSGLFQWSSPTLGTYPIRIRANVVGDTLFSDQRFALVIKPDTTSSVNELDVVLQSARLYPVPAGNNVNLEFSQPSQYDVTATFLDAKGCVVHSALVPAGTPLTTFDTGVIADGVYVLMIEAAGTTQYLPLIIHR